MKTPKLKANVEVGEGYIKMPDDWHEHDLLLRADILKDWAYALEQEYLATVVLLYKDDTIRRAKSKKNKAMNNLVKWQQDLGVK